MLKKEVYLKAAQLIYDNEKFMPTCNAIIYVVSCDPVIYNVREHIDAFEKFMCDIGVFIGNDSLYEHWGVWFDDRTLREPRILGLLFFYWELTFNEEL